jgi:hypothetical protein
MSFSVSVKCTALHTRCFLYTWSQHFMISKSGGYNMLVQFGVQSLSFTFLRNNISCAQAAHVSTDNKIFLPCPCMRHPLPLKGLWKWSCSTTIFYLHFILQEVLYIFNTLWFQWYLTMIRACFHCHDCSHTYSRIVILTMAPFLTWQDWPFIVNVPYGKQL